MPIVPYQGLQPLAALWQEVMRSHFLSGLDAGEALRALEEQRGLIERFRSLLLTEAAPAKRGYLARDLVMEHHRILLEAELRWLERAVARASAAASEPEAPL